MLWLIERKHSVNDFCVMSIVLHILQNLTLENSSAK